MSALVRGIRIVALGATAAAAAACEPPTVPLRDVAYNFVFEGFGERLIYRWPVGEEIGVYVVPSGDGARDRVLADAFAHTASAWNAAVLYGEYELVAADLDEADVILAWANDPLPIDTDECAPFPSGAAWTTFCSDPDFESILSYPLIEGEHREDGVHMIVQLIYNPASLDLVPALVAHEFGHVLGIGTHPCDLADAGCSRRDGAHESLMYEGIPERSTPSGADRETIEMLYHTTPDLTP